MHTATRATKNDISTRAPPPSNRANVATCQSVLGKREVIRDKREEIKWQKVGDINPHLFIQAILRIVTNKFRIVGGKDN